MTTPDVKASYHDLSSLHQLRANAKNDEVGAIKQAAQQFESVFMGMLMSSMRKANAAFEEDNPLNSQATEFFRDMHDSQMSAELSKQGSLGLADLMVQQLAPQHSKTKVASQISSPSRFDSAVKPAMKLPGSDQPMMALKPAAHAVFKLDAERIVRPTLAPTLEIPPKVGIQQLDNNREVLTVGGADSTLTAWPSVQAPKGVQQLAAEEIVGTVRESQILAAASTTKFIPETRNINELAMPAEAARSQPTSITLTAAQSSNDPTLDFVRQLLPAAEQAAARLGLEPLALVAQAALETGWGQRMFKATSGEQSHNLFGIKANQQWQGKVAVVDTLEYRQGVAQQEKARFRAYDNIEQSLHDYVDLIQSNPRYQAALEVAGDTKAYFQQLQAAGYATDPNYAQKIWSVFQGSTFKEVRNLLATPE